MAVRVPASVICPVFAVLALSACSEQAPEPASPPEQVTPAPSAAASKAPAEPKLTLGRGDKLLTIRSDQDRVAISGVFLDGQPLKTEGLGTPSVRALLVAEPEEGYGTPCESDGFEVRLANGVSFRPLTNFCNSKYVMTVPAAKPALPEPLPSPPEELSWTVAEQGNDKVIFYGIPETDATMLLATCGKGFGRAQLRFFEDAGPSPRVDVYAADRLLRYDLKVVSAGSDEEAPSNEIELDIDDPLWSHLRKAGLVTLRFGSGEFRGVATKQGAGAIGEFIAWCKG